MINSNLEYSISEVSELTGYAPHVLRYYEKEFEINIPRKDSNHRYYTIKEIELIQYIKDLKEKGFGNKQIKLIINSPEQVLTNNNQRSNGLVAEGEINLDKDSIALEISQAISENFFQKLSEYLSKENNDTKNLIEALKEEIFSLKGEIKSKERDILISENAKLKMKVKEKTFENIKLKDDLAKLKEGKGGIFKKLFRKDN